MRTFSLAWLSLFVAPFFVAPDAQAQRAARDGDPFAATTDTEAQNATITKVYDRVQRARRGLAVDDAVTSGPSVGFVTVNDLPENDMPREVAYSADGTEAVIVGRDTDTVSFLDVATLAIPHSVTVGDFPVHVAVTPDNQYAVVPNLSSDTVSIIDIPTHSLVANVPITGSQPFRVAVTSDSAFAVVGVINDGVNSSISVIDLATQTEVRSFGTVPQGAYGFFFTPEPGIFGNLYTTFALSPDDATLVIPDRGNDQVAIYDITNGSQVAVLPTDAVPTSVDISDDGALAVIGLQGGGATVVTIDLTVLSITNSFVTPNSPSAALIRVTPDKTHAILPIQNAVEFINLTTGAVASTISTGVVGDIEISFDGQYALVSNFNFRIIDIASQSLVKTIPFAACVESAASPTQQRVVALNNRFREDAHVYDTDGAAGFLEGAVLTGPANEADAPRTLAVVPDGSRVLIAGNTSDNVTALDLPTFQVAGYLPAGRRALGIEVSEDGQTAVVANGTDDTVSILDLGVPFTEVATLSTPATPAEVEISPDGTRAYVTSLAGTDRLYFIDLAGGASSVTASLITGQMGSVGYTYGVFSGLTLSPDGSTLAVCISFDDELLLVDTATETEIARVPVGDFPIRASFSSDSSKVYVSHSFGDNLYEVTVAGAGSSVTGIAQNIEFPLQVTVGPEDEFVYVGSFDFSNPNLAVVETASMTKVATVPLNSRPRSHARAGSGLFVTLTDGELARVALAGPATSVVETVPLDGSPSDMVFSAATGLAICAQPGADDGVNLVQFGGGSQVYCSPAIPNSTGNSAVISASGTFLAGGYPLRLTASDMPMNQFGYFLAGQTQGLIVMPGGSQGNLCLNGTIGRFRKDVQSSGMDGEFSLDVDTNKIPLSPPVAILAGETWNFTAWFRDNNPTATSNFTDAISILFD